MKVADLPICFQPFPTKLTYFFKTYDILCHHMTLPFTAQQDISNSPRWRVPGQKRIVTAAANERQVVIALSGGEILYFEIDESHTLNEALSWRKSSCWNNDFGEFRVTELVKTQLVDIRIHYELRWMFWVFQVGWCRLAVFNSSNICITFWYRKTYMVLVLHVNHNMRKYDHTFGPPILEHSSLFKNIFTLFFLVFVSLKWLAFFGLAVAAFGSTGGQTRHELRGAVYCGRKAQLYFCGLRWVGHPKNFQKRSHFYQHMAVLGWFDMIRHQHQSRNFSLKFSKTTSTNKSTNKSTKFNNTQQINPTI